MYREYVIILTIFSLWFGISGLLMTNKLAYGIMECMLSRNENELISIGENLGSVCQAGQVILLSGNLGAGKTTLVKGIAKGLGIEQMIKSLEPIRLYANMKDVYHYFI